MRRTFKFAIIFLFIVGGCSEDFFNPIVEIDIPVVKAKLVLYSLLAEGDQTVSVFLTHSRHPLGINNYSVLDSSVFKYYDIKKMDSVRMVFYRLADYPDSVSNARVNLYQQNTLIASLTKKDKTSFQTTLPGSGIKAGQEYTIKIDAPGYDAIEATTIIPNAVPIDTVFYTPKVKHVSSGIDLHTFVTDDYDIKLRDPIKEPNFYDIFGFVRDTFNGQILNEYIQLYGIDEIADDKFLTDQGRNGQTITWKRYSDPFQYRKMFVRLYSISESYYQFRLSADKMFNNRDNPFAEPSILYSNVSNGYGFFGGYSFNEKEIKLR
jgi:hypothetical protein